MKLVEANPEISQRELAKNLGISLGKTNFFLKALVEIGLIKVTNFRNNHNKLAYMYLLTPNGIEEKSTTTIRFLKAKIREFELLQAEIILLTKEAKADISPEQTSNLNSISLTTIDSKH